MKNFFKNHIVHIVLFLIILFTLGRTNELKRNIAEMQTRLDTVSNSLGDRVTVIEALNGNNLAKAFEVNDEKQATLAATLKMMQERTDQAWNMAGRADQEVSTGSVSTLGRLNLNFGATSVLALVELTKKFDTDADGVLNENDLCPTVHWRDADGEPDDISTDHDDDGCADLEDVSGRLASLGITGFGGYSTTNDNNLLYAYWHAKRGEHGYSVFCVPLAADKSAFVIDLATATEAAKKTPPPIVGKCWLGPGD